MSNRKLIRPNLSELKERIQNKPQAPAAPVQDHQALYGLPDENHLEAQPPRADRHSRTAVIERPGSELRPGQTDRAEPGPRPMQRPPMRRKQIPPESTAAEAFYYLKQMNSRTQMVVVLMDGEELHGIIEWYDRYCVKLNRVGAPNLLVFKQQVKYMFKAEELRGARAGEGADVQDPQGGARGTAPDSPEFDRA